jgi:hypothetical protein
MTVGLCLVCGAEKWGAFNPCGDCSWAPSTDDERIRSTMLSDHHFPRKKLAEIGGEIRRGVDVRLDEDQVAAGVEQMRSLNIGFEGGIPDVPPGNDPALVACRSLREALVSLSSLAHSRGRYLQRLQKPKEIQVDDVQLRALQILNTLITKEVSAAVPLYVRLVSLPNVPTASVLALMGLGTGPQGRTARMAKVRIDALNPGEQQTIGKALRRLIAQVNHPILAEVVKLLPPPDEEDKL